MNAGSVIEMLKTGSLNVIKTLYNKHDSLCQKIHNKSFFYKISFILIMVVFFSIILFLNINTPLTGDDYVYSFLYQTSNRLTSIGDIFESQYSHYFIWGGRSIVHFISQLLLLINNPLIIDIINSLAFIAFIYVIYLHIAGSKAQSISLLITVFCLMWILQPAFAETILWITGSANYLWGTLIILTFLLPFRLYVNKPIKPVFALFYSLLMFLSGIIAGWTNENTAAAMIIMVILFLLYYKSKKYNIPLWMYMGLFGAICGYVIMIAAPGNFVRAEGTSLSPFLIIYRALTSTQRFVNYLGLLNLGIICLIILIQNIKNKTENNFYHYLLILFIGVFVSIYIMIASPGFPPRSWFGPITLNIIIFGIVFYNLPSDIKFLRQIKECIVIFLVVTFCFSFYDASRDVLKIDKIWKERLALIDQKHVDNQSSVAFKEYQAKTKFGLGDTPYALNYISLYYNIDFQLEK